MRLLFLCMVGGSLVNGVGSGFQGIRLVVLFWGLLLGMDGGFD